METDLLYAKDTESAYIKSFIAKVIHLDFDDKIIWLDRTAFYPTGGGQPHDQGILKTENAAIKVIRVKKSGLVVEHYVDDIPDSLSIGDTIEGVIDWDLRYKYLRTHTAMHVLCGVIYNEFGSTVTGGQIKKLEGRMDFDIESFSKEKIKFIENKCNEAIEQDYPIKIAFLPRKEADKDPDLIRTKVNLIPPEIKVIRTVDIVGLDKQADGGTHVRSTKEIGRMIITKVDNRGKGRKRLYFSIKD
jgi:misacylated tRNA(Ala) deacylase